MTTETPTGTPEKSSYVIEAFDELPPAPPRSSKLVEVLEKVKAQPHGKPVLIKRFDSAQKATGTANHLKIRWGTKPDAYGFTFKTRKVDENTHGLFVIYEPNKIVPGAATDVEKKYNEYREKTAEKARNKTKAPAAKNPLESKPGLKPVK